MPLYRREENGRFVPFEQPAIELEQLLEDWIENNPHLLLDGEQLAVFGRQPRTTHGKYLDLLAVDASGACVIAELKRGEAPRDVVAQALEYASWVDSLALEQLDDIARQYAERRGIEASGLADIYRQVFGSEAEEGPPEHEPAERITFNNRQRIVIVVGSFAPEVEQTLRYLRTRVGMDVTGVAFSIHRAGGETLIETDTVVGREATIGVGGKGPRGSREAEPDESIMERVETDFLRQAVTGVEQWIQELGQPDMQVRHGGTSHHRLVHLGRSIGGYYFAAWWLFCWLNPYSPEDEAFLKANLSKPEEVRAQRGSVRFHVVNDPDLEVWKKLIMARVGRVGP